MLNALIFPYLARLEDQIDRLDGVEFVVVESCFYSGAQWVGVSSLDIRLQGFGRFAYPPYRPISR